jgi:hypothetical protein
MVCRLAYLTDDRMNPARLKERQSGEFSEVLCQRMSSLFNSQRLQWFNARASSRRNVRSK